MKNLVFLTLILISPFFLTAQINGITETGDEVILYQNGTWEYLNDNITTGIQIPVNDQLFLKDDQSTFLVKSKKLNIGVWINPKDWSFSQGTDSDAFELQFQKKSDDLYGMLIAEKMQIPIDVLKGVAIENAKNVAPDIKVINEEYRNVNGTQVLMMQMAGTIQGIRFTYYGYYYSNSNGTIQLLTYTGESLFNDYFEDIEMFLNGFVEL